MGEQRKTAVAAMLGARSVAVVGASARPDSFGARMIVEAQRSSATHAGGGVCGIPGWQAARAALTDRKRNPRRVRAALARRVS